MRYNRPPLATTRCPKCSFPVPAGSATCDNCGALVELARLGRENSALINMVQRAVGKPLHEIPAHRYVLILACIPFLLGPPVLALAIAGWMILRERTRWELPEWRKPVVIAVLNVVVSVMIWQALAEQAVVLLEWSRSFLGLGLIPVPVPFPVPGPGGPHLQPI